MKRLLLASTCLISLTGCGTMGGQPAAPEDPASFINSIRGDFPRETANISDSYLLTGAHAICREYHAGTSISDMEDEGFKTGVNHRLVVSLVENSIYYMCPNS